MNNLVRQKQPKKKTLTSLGDGDSYNDKLNRNKQPHQQVFFYTYKRYMQCQDFKKLGDGDYPAFCLGAKLTPFFYGKFTLINKARYRTKVFEPFEDSSKNSPMINAILISYGCVFMRSCKPVMKGSRVESIEKARNEYKKLLK